MQEFEGFINQDTDWILTMFLALFSAFIAIFYTFIFIAFYKENLKPKWLFFVLLPGIIISTKLIFNKYVIVAFILVFTGTFLLFFIGGICKGIRVLNKKISKRLKKERPSTVYFSVVKNLLFGGVLLVAFFLLGPYVFPFIFLFIIVKALFFKNNNRTFLSIQANLPTSNIQSMAMGLVEVVGKTIMQEALASKIGKKPCIGYRYKVERISKDKNGKKQYSTISDEVVCNDFLLEDDTAQVKIKASDIHFLWIEENESYSSGSKRYTQYLLLDNENVLLIGKASSKSNTVFIEKEPIKNIFTLAPYNSVTKWNRNKPLLTSFLTYVAILFLIIGSLLITEINQTEEVIQFKFNLPWNSISTTKIVE